MRIRLVCRVRVFVGTCRTILSPNRRRFQRQGPLYHLSRRPKCPNRQFFTPKNRRNLKNRCETTKNATSMRFVAKWRSRTEEYSTFRCECVFPTPRFTEIERADPPLSLLRITFTLSSSVKHTRVRFFEAMPIVCLVWVLTLCSGGGEAKQGKQSSVIIRFLFRFSRGRKGKRNPSQ